MSLRSYSSIRSPNFHDSTVPKAVKGILKMLGLPLTPEGARRVLSNLGKSSTPAYRPKWGTLVVPGATTYTDGSARRAEHHSATSTSSTPSASSASSSSSSPTSTAGSSSADYTGVRNITPWSAEVVQAAQKLKEECDAHKRGLNYIPPPSSTGKKGNRFLCES